MSLERPRAARSAALAFSCLLALLATSDQATGQQPIPRPLPQAAPTVIRPQKLGPVIPPAAPGLLIGAGVSDITGPAAEVGMMGYGEGSQVTMGIQTRLWARAFVFANPTTNKRVVYVSAELGQLFSSIRQGVIAQLKQRFPGLYDENNVQIAATHTHGGPGGYSHFLMYNVTTKGFVKQNYDAIVAGIVDAIAIAHGRLFKGSLLVAEGTLADASIQRAPTALALDPDRPTPNVNQTMTVLKMVQGNASPGMISWFAVHNASVSKNNRLITSDNKGHAALLFEKRRGTILPFERRGEFVAAFANSEEGDVSPNTDPGFKGPGGRTEFDAAAFIGEKQANAAERIWNDAREDVGTEIDFRHTFVDMPVFSVRNTSFTNGAGGKTLCTAASGFSMAAGAKDGPTGAFREGVTNASVEPALLFAARQGGMAVVAPLLPPGLHFVIPAAAALAQAEPMWNDPCQYPKPILIPSGALGATPRVLPFQILRIGSLVILGVPGEMTTTAGRRLTARIKNLLLASGVTRVIISGLSNEYSGYITTPEEYNSQQYEGASTLFGRLTFEAYVQIFSDLALAMAAKQQVPAGAAQQLLPGQIGFQTGVVADAPRQGEVMGQVLTDVPPVVPSANERWGWVKATFRAGHPKNDLRLNNTYVMVEKKVNGNWVRVAWDAMPEVRYVWRRDGGATDVFSIAEASWLPPEHTTGTFRIKHYGSWLTNFQVRPYEGTSREFEVRDENPACVGLRTQEAQKRAEVTRIVNQLGALGRQQQDCQAGRGGTGPAGKPRQCVDAEDKQAKAALEAQKTAATAAVNAVVSQKSAAGCVN